MVVLEEKCSVKDIIFSSTLFYGVQTEKSQRYRFSIVLNELKNAELFAYKTTLLAFINAILMSTIDFNERRQIRNEFIGRIESRLLSSLSTNLFVFIIYK